MNETTSAAEAVGQHYELAMMLEARRRTRQAIERIAAGIAPGMLEEAAMDHARQVLKEAQMVRGWHGIHVRFGLNTLKPFGVPSEPGVVLQQNDIFFIDIGPVWQKWEGDGGETFVVGNDPQMHQAKRAVREVFDRVRAKWLSDRVSGQELYRYAEAQARSLGWELNLHMSGHRLADFPHAALHKGSLADAPFSPSNALWVLEIQIRHPERAFSAFYEDLLLDP
ncbi:MAG: aminopeptidase P family protein [Proteobacteria bacterium]|nr:aminopeptidase P family protein [Pseudomonadota bacterium]